VTVHSDAGDGRAHRVALTVYVLSADRVRRTTSALHFRRAGTRRATLRLSRRARRLLAGRAFVAVTVTAQQRVGRGLRATDAGFSGATVTFGRPPTAGSRSPR
jgi:hypothetical protein